MGVKKINKFHLVTDAPMASGFSSVAQNIENFDNLGMQVSWTGTAAGTVSVTTSIDGTNYSALTFSPSITQPAGASGSFLLNLNQVPYPLIKINYAATSGTGKFNTYIFSKDIN
jgi:hypothetical protein